MLIYPFIHKVVTVPLSDWGKAAARRIASGDLTQEIEVNSQQRGG